MCDKTPAGCKWSGCSGVLPPRAACYSTGGFCHSVRSLSGERIAYTTYQYDNNTSTDEGFWSLVKRAILGHHHYTIEHAAMYIDEASYKYNTPGNRLPLTAA